MERTRPTAEVRCPSTSPVVDRPTAAAYDARSSHERRRSMEFETILYEKEGGKARITLNRPEKLNALSMRLQRELPTNKTVQHSAPTGRSVAF